MYLWLGVADILDASPPLVQQQKLIFWTVFNPLNMGNRQDTYIHNTVSCLGVWNKNEEKEEEEEEEEEEQQQQQHHFTPETPPIILDFLASPHQRCQARREVPGPESQIFPPIASSLRVLQRVSCGDGSQQPQKRSTKVQKSNIQP